MSIPMLPRQRPELTGPGGSAWQIDVDAADAKMRAKRPDYIPPPSELSTAAWIVHAPAAHPAWHSYVILCVGLRDIPGFPEAKIYRPGSTREVMVFALDPGKPVVLDDSPSTLHPINFAGQFTEPSDEAAVTRIRAVVQEIVDGELSPDTDYRRDWVARFGGSNFKLDKPLDDHIVATPEGDVIAVGTGKAMAETLAIAASLGLSIKPETK